MERERVSDYKMHWGRVCWLPTNQYPFSPSSLLTESLHLVASDKTVNVRRLRYS